MHLQDQQGLQFLRIEPVLHGQHGALDQVGGGALHRRVDCGALGALAAAGIRRPDFRQPEAAAEYGLDIALVARAGTGLFHVAGDARIAREVAVHVGLRRGAVDADLFRQAEGAHAVDQAEVDRLGGTALLAGHLDRRQAEDFAGGGAMHVLALGEGFQQARVVGEVGHDAQLDLRIVGADDTVIRRCDEGGADTATFGGADRDVLQVGVGRGQPAGDGGGLAEAGMHAAGGRVDHLRQLVGVGVLQLGETAMFEDLLRQRVILGQFFQHFLVGRGAARGRLLHHRQALLVEQYLGQLFR